MDEEDPLCVGICLIDPESGYCMGCGRRSIDFGPAAADTTPEPECSQKPEQPSPNKDS
jgi:hypothetical protein